MELLLIIFILVFKIFSSPVPAFAGEEFDTKHDVIYQVETTGQTKVFQEISLINKFSNIYATQYSLTLKGASIENIEAYDKEGPLKMEIKKTNEQTTVVLNFNQQVVGKGKTLTFNLSYTTPHVAQKKGQIWEINIPRLTEESPVDEYTLTLKVPKIFGEPAYIKPSPVEKLKEGEYNLFRFTKNQISSLSINAVLGEFQIFDFSIFYHLENPHSLRAEMEIPIPPDTAFQKITYKKIAPFPNDVRVDNDGNWLAKYFLNPKEKITVSVEGKAKIFSEPQEFFPPPSKENLENNLRPQKFWEVDAPQIFNKAQELKTPRAIYDFVIRTLDYDATRANKDPERMGALKSLENPQKAICMEFTDLFVALCRAAGIPAREINGFAFTSERKINSFGLFKDVLHSWGEYYDEKRRIWIPVDPTWEETTGGIDYFSKPDLNHFTFVIHGESSEIPHPPGSYKKEEDIIKDIHVFFGEYEAEKNPEIKVDFLIPSKIFWGIKNKGKVIIKNYGPTAVYNLKVKIEGEGIELKFLDFSPVLSSFPPFANKEIEIEIKPKSLLNFSSGKVIVSLNESKFYHSVEVNLFDKKFIWGVGIGVLIFILLIFLTNKKFYARKN